MPRAVCPDCEECVIITPTGEKKREGFSAEWWVIAMHPSKEEKAGSIVVWTKCDGSGKRV